MRVERDETIYPSKGTWPKFRGKTGTIVEVNLGEYGVVFTKVRKPRSNGSIAMAEAVWFQPHEVRVLAEHQPPQRRREPRNRAVGHPVYPESLLTPLSLTAGAGMAF